jgi:hypothetical protein
MIGGRAPCFVFTAFADRDELRGVLEGCEGVMMNIRKPRNKTSARRSVMGFERRNDRAAMAKINL